MTCQDILNSALRLLGVLASKETPSADESYDGLTALNQLIASWNLEHVSVFAIKTASLALTAAQQTYTLGTGGVFNTARPAKIQSITVSVGSMDLAIKPVSSLEWAAIEEKSLSGLRPLMMYNDNAYPLANLSFWPKPSGTPTVTLYMWQKLTGVTLRQYTDLVIDGTTNTKVSSALQPFVAGDVGAYINVAGGTGFTVQRAKISSVTGGVATCDRAMGTLSSTGGSGTYDQDFDFPDGYERALKTNLAIDLAPEYGKPVDQTLAAMASQSKGELIAINASNIAAREDPPQNPQAA